jgi:phage gp29-like protein
MNTEKVEAANSSAAASITTGGLGKMIGASGTAIMKGVVVGEEYNQRLTGKFAIRQYEVMRRSEASVEAALEVIKQPILNVERRIDAASDATNDDYAARFISRELFDRNIDFYQMMEEALTFLDFGHSVMEFELELTEFEGKTRVGIASIEFRKQISIESWETEDGKPGIQQQLVTPGPDGKLKVSIPRIKILHWVNKKEGENHLGVSMLRYTFKDWDFKDKTGILHMIALEKGGVPTPILGIPDGAAGSKELELAIDSLKEYRSNERGYIIKPNGWDLSSLDMTGQSLKEFIPTLQYFDRQIYISVLAGFLALGSSTGSGSRAVGEIQYKPYIQKLSTINRRFEAPIQHFINFLCDRNFSDLPNGYPKLKSGRFSDEDVANLANAIKNLKDAGFLNPTFEDEKHLRKTLHMPDAPDDLKEVYDLKQQQAIDIIKNPPAIDPNLPDPNAPKPDKNQPPKPGDKTKASRTIANAEHVQRQLIDVIIR